jgi:hypothetical protein
VALLDDIKLSLRVTTGALDAEVQMLCDAALYDMERAGVNANMIPLARDDAAEMPKDAKRNAHVPEIRHTGEQCFARSEDGRCQDGQHRIL